MKSTPPMAFRKTLKALTGHPVTTLVTALVLFFVAWLILRTLVPRPVVFSHLLLAALIVVLGERRLRWTVPLLMWVWAAVHGSFVIGLGLIGLEAIRTRARPLWGVLRSRARCPPRSRRAPDARA